MSAILEYFTNNVKSVKITEMVQQVMNKSTKISLPTDSMVPAYTGRLTFMMTFDITFITASNAFLVFPEIRLLPTFPEPHASFTNLLRSELPPLLTKRGFCSKSSILYFVLFPLYGSLSSTV